MLAHSQVCAHSQHNTRTAQHAKAQNKKQKKENEQQQKTTTKQKIRKRQRHHHTPRRPTSLTHQADMLVHRLACSYTQRMRTAPAKTKVTK